MCAPASWQAWPGHELSGVYLRGYDTPPSSATFGNAFQAELERDLGVRLRTSSSTYVGSRHVCMYGDSEQAPEQTAQQADFQSCFKLLPSVSFGTPWTIPGHLWPVLERYSEVVFGS